MSLLSEALHLLNDLRGRGEILIPILGDVDVVFDAHTSDAPVSLQDLGVDVLAQRWGLHDRVNDEATKIDLMEVSSIYLLRPSVSLSLPRVQR